MNLKYTFDFFDFKTKATVHVAALTSDKNTHKWTHTDKMNVLVNPVGTY